jgi:hypothetical protein
LRQKRQSYQSSEKYNLDKRAAQLPLVFVKNEAKVTRHKEEEAGFFLNFQFTQTI